MRSLLLLLAAAMAAQPQTSESIAIDFTRQNLMVGSLQVYMASVCNNGPVLAPVLQARDVWPVAEKRNILLQGPVAILKAEREGTTKSKKAWLLWGAAGGCAVASAVTNGGAVALNPAKGIGKIVAYGTAGCAMGLPVVAETIKRAPDSSVEIPEGERLPATFLVGPGDCKQGYVFALMPFGLKAVP